MIIFPAYIVTGVLTIPPGTILFLITILPAAMPGKQLFGIIFLVVAAAECLAQRPRPAIRREIRAWRQAQKTLSPLSVTFRGASTQFWGELNDRNFNTSLGFGLRAHLKDAEAFSFGLDFSAGRLSGEKKAFFNAGFVNRFSSVELIPEWDIVRAIRRDPEERLALNLYAGIGLSFFSAEAHDLATGERLRFTNHPENSGRTPHFKRYGPPKGKTGVRKTRERIIPTGVAAAYSLSKTTSIGFDLRCHFARTDKLDATSGMRLINPEEADSYSDTPNDRYSSAALFIRYRFLKSRKR